MTDAAEVTSARPKRKGGDRAAPNGPVLVSGGRLALHLRCTRQVVDQMAQQGIIRREANGLFNQDQARWAVLDHLRSERRGSTNAAATAELARAKAAMLDLKVKRERKILMTVEQHFAVIDEIAGITNAGLSSLGAMLFPMDLAQRRRVEAAVLQIRKEMSLRAQARADELERDHAQ